MLARAEYHTLVRRLHLAGASLREVAEALDMSHQRVQQIVQGAGGTWWSRMWRTRGGRRDAVCTFCGRPPSEVARLVAGPDVFACDGCVEAAEKALGALAGPRPKRGVALAPPGSRARCSFCGKRCGSDRPVAWSAEAAVCASCLAQCRRIIEDSGPSPGGAAALRAG